MQYKLNIQQQAMHHEQAMQKLLNAGSKPNSYAKIMMSSAHFW